MTRTLRALVVAAVLLASLFGVTTASASPAPATSVSQAQLAHTTATADSVASPRAQYQCAASLVPPPPYQVYQYACVITSGFLQYVAHCINGLLVSTGWLPKGTYRGTLTCLAGILYVAKFTQG